MSRPGMRPMWQPERAGDWREAERRAAEALREAHRRSAPQSAPEVPAQPQTPEQAPASLPRPEAAPQPRFRRPWRDYEEGDESVWRAQDDDEPDFFPPAPQPPRPTPQRPEPPEAPQREQRSPVDRETLLVAALLYILWTQEADKELLAAMAYILL